MEMRIITIAAFFFAFNTNAQWTLFTDSIGYVTHQYVDMQFANEDTGYVIGRMNGTQGIMRTFDQGVTWDTVYFDEILGVEGLFVNPTKVHFPEPCIGYIVGYNEIIKTTDCGATWFAIDTMDVFSGALNLRDIIFMNKDTGFVGWADGGSGGIVTSDGGWTWEESPGLSGVRKLNAYDGQITACANHWYELDETNLEWTDFEPPVFGSGEFWSDCIKKNGNHIVIESNLYAVTPDLGSTWYNYYVPIGIMKGIYFYTDQVGFLTGISGGCRKTIDGGATWFITGADNLGTGMSTQFSVVQMVNDSIGFAMSDEGLYKTTNGGGEGDFVDFLSLEEIKTNELLISPNPVQNILNIANENLDFNHCYVFDHSGKMILSENVNTNQIDVSSLRTGTYWLLVISENKEFKCQFLKL